MYLMVFFCDGDKQLHCVCVQRVIVTTEGCRTAHVMRSGAACAVRKWRGGDATDADQGTTPSQTATVREARGLVHTNIIQNFRFHNNQSKSSSVFTWLCDQRGFRLDAISQ